MASDPEDAGRVADQRFDESEVGGTTAPCAAPREPAPKLEAHWIELELVGEDDEPMSGTRYRIELEDGKIIEGRLGKTGVLRLEGLSAKPCRMGFPDLDDEAWAPLG